MLSFLGRTLRFSFYSTLMVLRYLLTRPFNRHVGPPLLRWYFQTMGAAFVKLGQFLSTRYDLLPPAYSEELATLLDRLPPVPTAGIIARIEHDLGRPLSDCFASFDREPLASASVAQVHAATLQKDGVRVVVKVLRPGIERRFRIDFLYFHFFAYLLDRVSILPNVSFQDLMKELTSLSDEELDLRREARHLDEMKKLMSKDGLDHDSPAVYFSHSNKAVLTMERVEGVSVAQLIYAQENNQQEQLKAWKERGICVKRTAKLLIRSLLEQTYHHRVFHADPHAGNLIVKDGGTLVWLDFGMIGWLDERIWAQQFRLREAISAQKLHAAYQGMIATLEPLPPGKNLSRFEAELKGFIRDWIVASKTPNATLQEKSSGYFLMRAFDAIRRAGLSLPAGVMRLYRSMIIGDMVMLKLDPEIDWVSQIAEFVQEESQRQVRVLLVEAASPLAMSTALRTYASIPGAAAEMLDWVQNRLPELGRTYQDQLSRIERAVSLAMSYTRVVFLFILLALVGSALIAPRWFPGGPWERLWVVLTPYGGWVSVVVTGLTVLFLGRINRVFKRS